MLQPEGGGVARCEGGNGGWRQPAQNEKADELWPTVDEGDPKTAIETCLDLCEKCYVADGESVAKAKELLARYRDDPAIAKKHKRLLKSTEGWK